MKAEVYSIEASESCLTYVDNSVDVSNLKSIGIDTAENRSKTAADYLNAAWGDGEDGYATWKDDAEGLWYDLMSDEDGICAVAGDKNGIVYFEGVNLRASVKGIFFDIEVSGGAISLRINDEYDDDYDYTPDLNEFLLKRASTLLNEDEASDLCQLKHLAEKLHRDSESLAWNKDGTDDELKAIEEAINASSLPKLNVAQDYDDLDYVTDLDYDAHHNSDVECPEPDTEEYDEWVKGQIERVSDEIEKIACRIDKYLDEVSEKYENY